MIAVGEEFKVKSILEKKYHIIDLAPTILNLVGIKKPVEMDGEIIVRAAKHQPQTQEEL